MNCRPIDRRPQLGAWAPGDYFCKCYKCYWGFLGDKRAVECSVCAYGDFVQQTPKAKETAILFSGAMPEAAMSGRKTQTRRLVKFKWMGTSQELMRKSSFELAYKCPYGKPGDRLRFLGTWAVAREYDRVKPSLLPSDVRIWSVYSVESKPIWCGKSRPGRFMPKWMRSQMPLAEITGIRVDRLQDISEEDAESEGVDVFEDGMGYSILKANGQRGGWHRTAKGVFIDLWESINGDGSWDLNPWVWVVEFRRVKP